MATPNRHRKLINNLTNTTTTFPFCVNQCNPQLNPTSLCISDCINFCPSFCHAAESSPEPSPTPTPAISPYEQSPPSHHHNHHPPLSLPLKISLIFLFATFIYTLYKFYTIWFRSRRHRTPPSPHSPENQETHDHDVVDHPIWYIRTTGLQPSVINAISAVKFDKTDCVIEGTDCSVCLTEFEIDDMLRLLPNCKHAFHISCIDTWLSSHTNCPLCRAGIVVNAVDARSPRRNNDDSGFTGETDLGVSSVRDGDQGEASGSSELRSGEIDENNNVSK